MVLMLRESCRDAYEALRHRVSLYMANARTPAQRAACIATLLGLTSSAAEYSAPVRHGLIYVVTFTTKESGRRSRSYRIYLLPDELELFKEYVTLAKSYSRRIIEYYRRAIVPFHLTWRDIQAVKLIAHDLPPPEDYSVSRLVRVVAQLQLLESAPVIEWRRR